MRDGGRATATAEHPPVFTELRAADRVGVREDRGEAAGEGPKANGAGSDRSDPWCDQQPLDEQGSRQLDVDRRIQQHHAGELRRQHALVVSRQQLLGHRRAVVVADEDGFPDAVTPPERLCQVRLLVDRVPVMPWLVRVAEAEEVEAEAAIAPFERRHDARPVPGARGEAVEEGEPRPRSRDAREDRMPVERHARTGVEPVVRRHVDFTVRSCQATRPVAATVNDIQSALNETVVDEIVPVDSLATITGAIKRGGAEGKAIAIAGGRHAMGGQQFCAGGLLLDTRGLAKVLDFDEERGLIEVEAGIQWPELMAHLRETQADRDRPWGIAQKQTGADRLSVGGAISANVHGRGLTLRPLISDVESFVLVDARGEPLTCSRSENADLFRLATGGYGLFGCVYSATLRLVPRQVVERVVEVMLIDELASGFESRIEDGFVYGDFQFATDATSDDLLRRGVFSCYRPVEHAGPLPASQRALAREDWDRLIYLAHTDKARAFSEYSTYYLSTTGQLYYSDAHQMADYADGYHERIDRLLGAADPATEMITEIYVPRDRLADFMAAVADDFRAHDTDVIYGTIRLIEPDEESFLRWATDRWACIIFNLHTVHTPEGLERSAEAFRRLIDRGIERGGSFYLTYHRWATRQQVETCYPQFPEFLRLKQEHDPDERFQSEWYRHYRELFASGSSPA